LEPLCLGLTKRKTKFFFYFFIIFLFFYTCSKMISSTFLAGQHSPGDAAATLSLAIGAACAGPHPSDDMMI
jgi:hypothetical protein